MTYNQLHSRVTSRHTAWMTRRVATVSRGLLWNRKPTPVYQQQSCGRDAPPPHATPKGHDSFQGTRSFQGTSKCVRDTTTRPSTISAVGLFDCVSQWVKLTTPFSYRSIMKYWLGVHKSVLMQIWTFWGQLGISHDVTNTQTCSFSIIKLNVLIYIQTRQPPTQSAALALCSAHNGWKWQVHHRDFEFEKSRPLIFCSGRYWLHLKWQSYWCFFCFHLVVTRY